MREQGPSDDQGAYWDEVARQDDPLPAGWRRHARTAHLALLARWLGEPGGRWLKTDLQEELIGERALLPHLAGDWIGTDISAVVCHAGRRIGLRAAVADVRALPFADGSLDGVLSTSTLDHFDQLGDLATALGELRRVLRPGGVLVLTLDNPRNPLIRLRNRLPRPVQEATGLVPFAVGVTLSARTGVPALHEAGFHVERVEHLLHAPHVVGTRLARFPGWERRALPFLDGLGGTRVAPWSGHYVAFLARAGGA